MLRSLIDLTTTTGMPIVLVLLKVTMVLLLAVGLTTLMRRASATARHLVWLASLLAMLAIPALSAWSPVKLAVLPSGFASATPAVSTPVPDIAPSTPGVVERNASGATIAAPTVQAAASSAVAEPSRGAQFVASPSPMRVIIALWAAVALALLAWLAHGADRVRRIVFEAEPLTDNAWQSSLMDIADRLQLDDMPRLVSSRAVTMPFACGFRVPTIVLPGDCDGWSAERRSAVLLHEVAHIRRRDIVGHTLGRVVCALYWFHPMAWMAARKLRAESERACDDLALGCGTRASDYAEHLLEIVTSVREHGTPSAAMAMATRSEFEGRMLAILDPTLARVAPTRMQASTLAGGVMMFAIVTGSVVPRATSLPPQRPDARPLQAAVVEDSTRGDREGTATMSRRDSARRDSAMPLPSASPVPTAGSAEMTLTGTGGTMTVSHTDDDREVADSSARSSALARILVSDSSASLRRLAAWGLHDHTDERAALSALLSAVRRDPSAAVREMAAWSLEEASGRDQVASVLADAIRTDKDRTVRETATWSLASDADGKSVETIEALASVLQDDDAEVREMAAWGIGNAGPRSVPSALIAALADRSPRVRATAAWALFQIEDDSAVPALDAALQREMDPRARQAMVRALSVMGDAAVAPLQRIIEGSDAALRAIAIRALAGQGSDPWPQPRPRPRPTPGF